MSKTGMILLGAGGATILTFGIIHAVKTSNTADKLDISLDSFSIKSAGISGIESLGSYNSAEEWLMDGLGIGNLEDLGKFSLNPKVVFSVSVTAKNPTPNDLKITKPYFKVYYQGKQIGSSVPSPENINIKGRNATPIKDMEIEFHALDVLPVMPDFIKYIAGRFQGQHSTRKVKVDMTTTANGLTTTKTQEIAL